MKSVLFERKGSETVIYEVKVKMHIEAESPERATELGILFHCPTKERMREYNIRCWIRDTNVWRCVKSERSKHGSFWEEEDET